MGIWTAGVPAMLAAEVSTVVLILVAALGSLTLIGAAVLIVLLVGGTEKKTKMGINLKPPTNCPLCHHPLPQVRIPRSLSEALWGGWTCKQCETSLDKWGRKRDPEP